MLLFKGVRVWRCLFDYSRLEKNKYLDVGVGLMVSGWFIICIWFDLMFGNEVWDIVDLKFGEWYVFVGDGLMIVFGWFIWFLI